MWLVLVAAGSGYLARCWQNAEKTKHAHAEHSACTEVDESIRSLEAPLGGNECPSPPAAKESQELCDDDSWEPLETSHGDEHHTAGSDEVVWKDRDKTSLVDVNDATTLFSRSVDTIGKENAGGNTLRESTPINASKSDGSYVGVHTAPDESYTLGLAIENKGPEESLKGREASPVGSFSAGGESPHNAQVETGVQRIYRNSRSLELHRSLGAMDERPEKAGMELGSNISSTARVSLAYLKNKYFGDLREDGGADGYEGIGSVRSKTKSKSGDERITNTSGRHASSFKTLLIAGSDCQDSNQPPRGCTQKGSYTRRLRTPNRSSKGRPLGRKVRVMRASPKPLSSLECCLMAQLDALDADLGRHVSRPLDFSSVLDPGKRLGITEDHNMTSFEKACEDSDAHIDEHGKIEECSTGHLSGLRGVIAPVQVLLFFIAVGVGAMCANKCHKSEVEGLQQSLKEAESAVQVLRKVLQQHGLSVPELKFFSKVGRVDTDGEPMAGVLEGVDESDDFASLRVLVTEGTSSMQDDQMADLEAELEAELDYLTGQFADESELELDGVAHVVHGDLNVKGLPANEDSDADDNSAPEVACINNYAVSPRELTRLLRKLQATRQEEHICELEADLERVQSQLESREKELQLWKGRVRRLTEFSLGSSVQGDENILLSTPSSGVITPFERPSPTTDSEPGLKTDIHDAAHLEDQGSVHPPVQSVASAGILKTSLLYSHHTAEKDTVGSGKQSTSGKADLRLTREVSFKESGREISFPQTQKPAVDRRLSFGDRQNSSWITDEFCDKFLRSMEDSSAEVGPQFDQLRQSTDSKSLFEDSQIEQLLLDSVEDLGSLGSHTSSVYDYATAATMADNWDNVLKSSTGIQNWSGSLHQKNSENPSRGYPLSEGRATGSPKSVSERSDGEYSRADTLAPLKYIESNSKPQGPGDENLTPFYWNRDVGGLGRAGANTPVDSRYVSNQSTKNASIDQKEPAISNLQVDLDSRVFDKVAGWDGLIRIDHSPAVRSDWECPSQSSESDQHGGTGAHALIGGTSCEESLVSEAEEYVGKIFVGQMVERSRQSSHTGEEAHASVATQTTIQAGLRKYPSLPHEVASRKARIKDGKASEEEEYELLCKSLPNNFDSMRSSDDRDCKRALFSEQMQLEGTTVKGDRDSILEDVGVSKAHKWEGRGKSPTKVARQSLRGNSQQDSRFRNQNWVKEAWSKHRL